MPLDPLSHSRHGDAEAAAGPAPDGGSAAGIVVALGEQAAHAWTEGRHPPAIGPWRLAGRRLRRDTVAQVFLVLLLALVAACLLAPVYSADVAHIGPNTNNITGTVSVNGKSRDVVSPSGVPIGPTFGSHYFLGADTNGRDLAVRLLYGGRTSLLIGAIATVIIIVLGTLAGLLAGFFRRSVDMVLRPLMELIWSFPVVILGVALGTALALGGIGPIKGNSVFIPAFIIGVVYIPYLGKPIRAEVLRVREQDFVDAARVQAPNASWGTLISDGLPYIQTTPTFSLIPGAMLVLTVLSINVVGDGIRDALDPRAQVRVRT